MRWHLGVVIACVLSGCIEDSLQPCADLSCPVGLVCHEAGGAPTCVHPDQLVVCVGAADGAACSFGRVTAASCSAEICQPLGCGNGVRTIDEACDDANNVNGDGCAADCHSDETCGNGLLDLAASEQCDDANADDLDACRNNCVLPRCGDGLLDPLEECEPSLDVSATCDDFGYYDGQLACSNTCRFDPVSSCTGRCGDAIVQDGEGEECDSANPVASCVDIGFDYGAATCTSSCSAASCERFEWKYVRAGVAFDDVASDTGIIAAAGPAGVHVWIAGSWEVRAGSYLAIDVRGDKVVAAKAAEVDVYEGATWTTLVAPVPSTGRIWDIDLATDGTITILAISSTTCEVSQYVGTGWTTTTVPVTCAHLAVAGNNNFAVGTGSSFYWKHPGGVRSEAWPSEVVGVRNNGTSIDIFFHSTGTLVGQPIPPAGPGGSQSTVTPFVTNAIASEGRSIVAIPNGFFPPVHYFENGTSRVVKTPAPAPGVILRPVVGHDGRLLAIVGGSAYRLGSYLPTQRTAPASVFALDTRIALLDDGTLAFCNNEVWLSALAGFSKISTVTGFKCAAVWGTSRDNFYVSRDKDGSGFAPTLVQHWQQGWTDELYNSAPFQATALGGEGAVVVAVLALTPNTIVEKSGTWSALPTLPAGCTAKAVARRGGVTYAAGGCSTTSKIWKQDQGAWVEVVSEALGPIDSLVVTTDGTVAGSNSSGRVITHAGGVSTVHPSVGRVVAGTESDDLFAASGIVINHWDGSRWSPIRVQPNTYFSGLVANARTVAAIGYDIPTPFPTLLFELLRE